MTTYLYGPAGLDVVYSGTAASWQLADAHGDVVGTADPAGAFTPLPSSDEFGVGTDPASRLGWLGAEGRFSEGGRLGE